MDLWEARPAILAMTASYSCVALARPGALPRASISRRWSVDILKHAIMHRLRETCCITTTTSGRIVIVKMTNLTVRQHIVFL